MINSGAYFCSGAKVLVREPDGTWYGQMLGISLLTGQGEVRVLDPRENTVRHFGDRVTCSYTELSVVRP